MATYVNLTVPGKDILGDLFDPRRASAYLTTNTPNGIIVVDSTSIRLGGRREKFNGAPTVVFENLVATNSANNPTAFAYRITIVYTPIGGRHQETWSSSDFTLTASANLAAISEAFDGLAIPPSWRSEFMDSAQSLLDQQEAIAGLTGEDAAIANRVNTVGSATDVALVAKYAGKSTEARVSTLPAAAATPRTYDAQRQIYNMKNGAARVVRAKIGAAIAGTGRAQIACLGTSIAAGAGATPSTTSYPVQLRKLLAATGVPIGGTGHVPCHHGDNVADSRWAFTGAWSKLDPGTAGGRNMLYVVSSTATATFTSDIAGQIVRVHYSNASSPFTVTIDGGTAVTVTPAGGTTIGTYQVTGLANTTHTVLVKWVSGTVYLAGANVRNLTGLEVHNLGLSGATVSNIRLGYQPYGALRFARDVIQPDLIIFNAMTNEAFLGQTAASYKTELQNVMTDLAATGVQVLLVAEPTANNLDLTPYRQALYEVAIAYDRPVVDMYERWGSSWATANALGLFSDDLHPTPAGYADYASALMAAIR